MAVKLNTSYAVNLAGGGTAPKVSATKSQTAAATGLSVKLPTAIDTSYGANTALKPISSLAPIPTAPKINPVVSPALIGGVSAGKVGLIGGGGGGSAVRIDGEGVIYGNPSVNNSTFNNISSPSLKQVTYGDNLPIRPTRDPSQPIVPTIAPTQTPTQEPAAATEPTPSYEEWLKEQAQGGAAKEALDKTTAAIDEQKRAAQELAEQQRAAAEHAAEVEHQRGVADARSSYAQNMASYGANAERLADMGLSGSGYSDYINSQAYAQQRAEVQGANAQATATKNQAQYIKDQAVLASEQQAANSKLSAELTYADNLNQAQGNYAKYMTAKEEEAAAKLEKEESERRALYADLLNYANNGTYTSEQLASIASKYGLSEEDIAGLKGAADTYKANKQQATYESLMQSTQSDMDYIDGLLNSDQITQSQYDEVKKGYQTSRYEGHLSNIQAGNPDTSIIEEDYKKGAITQEQYNKLKTEWNNNLDFTAAMYNGLTFDEATSLYETITKNSWCSADSKAKLESAYTRKFANELANKYCSGKVKGGTVDIMSSSYSSSQWGDFDGINKSGDWQYTYAQKIVEDAKAGKIPVGKVVTMNVGSVWSDYGCYVYVGNGVFVKVDCSGWSDPKKTYGDQLYIPDGYKIGGANNSIQRK